MDVISWKSFFFHLNSVILLSAVNLQFLFSWLEMNTNGRTKHFACSSDAIHDINYSVATIQECLSQGLIKNKDTKQWNWLKFWQKIEFSKIGIVHT